MSMLRQDIIEIRRLMPPATWEIVKSIKVYANHEFYKDGKQMHGAHAHYSREWLEENGNLPEKAGSRDLQHQRLCCLEAVLAFNIAP